MTTPAKLARKMSVEVEADPKFEAFAVILIGWEDNDLSNIFGSCKDLNKVLKKLQKQGKIADWRMESIHTEE